MNLFLLSSRSLISSVSWDPLFELENLFVNTCNAQLLEPVGRQSLQKISQSSCPTTKLFHKIIVKTIGEHRSPKPLPPINQGSNVLLLIGVCGADLNLLSSIPEWRKRFDLVIAYLCDSWAPEIYHKNVHYLDHLFVVLPEVIEPLKKSFGIPISLLPLGADVLTHGSNGLHRPIDLATFGRIPQNYDRVFFDKFNQPGSTHIYYRSTPRKTEEFPVVPYEQRKDDEDTRLLLHLLRQSKLMTAFNTQSSGMRKFPYSVVTLRWFYGWATGCAIVGKRPTTPIADELMNWENSTIELPDDPQQSVELIEELLKDEKLLHSIHRRNYLESLARHDWRYRIQSMFETMNIPLPHQLRQDLSKLKMLSLQHQEIHH